jgi:hypothetical protein
MKNDIKGIHFFKYIHYHCIFLHILKFIVNKGNQEDIKYIDYHLNLYNKHTFNNIINITSLTNINLCHKMIHKYALLVNNNNKIRKMYTRFQKNRRMFGSFGDMGSISCFLFYLKDLISFIFYHFFIYFIFHIYNNIYLFFFIIFYIIL